MLGKRLAAFAAAAALIVAAFSAPPADARPKKKAKRYNVPASSLERRTPAKPLDCVPGAFAYDGSGAPVGPYCH
jgi:hypothetical protein